MNQRVTLLTLLYLLPSTLPLEKQCETKGFCFKNKTLAEKLVSCFCAEDFCSKFDDCCEDSRRPLYHETSRKTCRHIPNTDSEIYLLDSCPAKWRDQSVFRLCNKEIELENYDYTLDLPFRSKKSGFIYTNVYCAMCNEDFFAPNQINFTLRIACSNGLNACKVNASDYFKGNYTPGALVWSLSEPKTQIQIKADVRNARGCRRGVVKHCASDWNDEKVSIRCRSYTNYVQRDSFLFKNVDCARCNHEINVTCPKLESPNARNAYSFADLMDFTVKLEKCPINHIYDLISSECKQMLCGKAYEKIGGKCVAKFASNNTFACNAIPVSTEDLIFLPNNSIQRKNTLELIPEQNYERFNASIYLICHETTDNSRFVRKFPYSYSRLTTICMSISLICLFSHITIHLVTGKYKNTPGKNQLNLSIALFVAQLLFFTGVNETKHPSICFALGVAIHFFYLSVFFWMNVMAFDIYKTFSRSYPRSNSNKTFFLYAVYAWATPLLIVASAASIDLSGAVPNLRPIYGHKVCWISTRFALFVFFALPLAILLIENVFLFLITAYGIHRTLKGSKKLKKSCECRRFNLYLKLAFVMGGTWVFGLAANLSDYDPLWYGFIILNASQGSFIFVVFTLKRGILRNLCEKITGKSVLRAKTSNTKTSCLEDAKILSKV